MKYALVVVVCLAPVLASATSVPRRDLSEIVKDSDHVLLATVTRVDMVDGKGQEVTDRKAKTGPGLDNEIRFHLEVKEVLFSTSKEPPKQVTVRLWKMWHYSLGKIQDSVSGHTAIFLLKGSNFEPAYEQSFERSLQERTEIELQLRNLGRK